MGLWDGIKNIMNVSDDDYDEEIEETQEEFVETPKKENKKEIKNERKGKTVPFSNANMQVVLVKPDRFEDVTAIADHYCSKKTVILNLEKSDRDLSRRIIDFLSGVAYAKNGSIRKAAHNTFIIAPCDVDVSGEIFLEEYGDGSSY